MSTYSSFLVALKSTLPESTWAWVILAIREDTLVWDSLQEPEMAGRALAEIGARPEGWSPASLALLSLRQPPSPGSPIAAQVRQRSLRAYEALVRQGTPERLENYDLAHAALLAIALAEHQRLSGTWNDLPADLRPAPTSSPLFLSTWRTPLAVLYGLTSDRQGLLRSLVYPGAPRPFQELALHALLSNPLPHTEQGQALGALIRDFPPVESSQFLHLLAARRPEQAARLARRLLGRGTSLPTARRAVSGMDQIDQLSQLLYQAGVNTLAAQPDQAASLHRQAFQQASALQIEIGFRLAVTAVAAGDLDGALETWRAASGKAEGLHPPPALLLSLLEAGRLGEALSLLSTVPSADPLHQLVTSYQAAVDEDLQKSRHLARQALDALFDLVHRAESSPASYGPASHGPASHGPAVTGPAGSNGASPDGSSQQASGGLPPLSSQQPLQRVAQLATPFLVTYFLDLALPAEAIRAAQLALSLHPNDPPLLALLAGAFRRAGETISAVEAAHLAVALDPSLPAPRRELAACLEAAGDWQTALAEREALLEDRFASPGGEPWPKPAELRTLAACALRAGQPQRAVEACQAALQLDPEDGLTHAALGQSLSALGHTEKAMAHFRQATQLSPQQAEPWLSLAQAQLNSGERERAVETLRAASHAVPEDPAVPLALAEVHLSSNTQTEAIAALRQAHAMTTNLARGKNGRLIPGEVAARERNVAARTSLLLGQALADQGHLVQARQVFESAYQANPAYPELAYSYARALLRLGEPRQALTPLAVAVNAGPANPSPYLDYARTMLEVQVQPEEAVRVLRKVLEITPRPERSNGNSSDYHSVKGNPKNSKLQSQTKTAVPNGPSSMPVNQNPAAQVAAILAGEPYLPARQEQTAAEAPADSRNYAMAQALLAEALAASGEPEAAMQAYYQALDTPLASEPGWQARLSLGLGRVALILDKPEIAIAALQEASQADSHDARIPQALSEAYIDLHLPKEALEAARAAVQLAPDEVEKLTWFASQCLRLSESAEAIPALYRAAQLAPERTDLLVQLAQVQTQAGTSADALETYRQIATAPLAEIEHLRQAAAGLISLGDPASAVACLERALETNPGPNPELWQDLAAAHYQAGDIERALEAADRAVQFEPGNPQLHLFKAGLLEALDRPQAAQACLEHALNLHPEDAEIRQRLILVLRARGQLAAALSQAEQMLVSFKSEPWGPKALAARALAGELARTLLQSDYARQLLGGTGSVKAELPAKPAGSASDGAGNLPVQPSAYFTLAAELALEREEEIPAAEAFTQAYQSSPSDPRVLALQARLSYRRGDSSGAQQALQAALDAVEEAGMAFYPNDPDGNSTEATAPAQEGGSTEAVGQTADSKAANERPAFSPAASDLIGIASAALELAYWDLAQYLLRRAIALASLEPYSHLQIARALVQRAEYQRLCQSLEAVAHAPGAEALSAAAFQSFEEALQTAARCLPPASQVLPAPVPALLRWRARGQAAFHPEQNDREALKALTAHPEDRAAYLAALAHSGDLAAIAQSYKSTQDLSGASLHPLVLAQFALSLGFKGRRQEDLSQALAAARAACERHHNQPLYHALYARLAQLSGDQETALRAINAALAAWPDEPRWQSQAGQLLLSAGSPPEAIEHLARAAELEPRHLPHHLAVGEAYLQIGNSQPAIQALEQAMRLAPRQLEPYMALAYAHLAQGDLDRAASAADSATSIAPEQAPPLLLRAEVALQLGDARGALKRAEAALRLKPNDPQALHLVACALEQLGRPAEALSVLEKAIPLTANPLPLLLERVHLLEKGQDSAGTLAALEELSIQYPEEPATLALLAKAQAESGQPELAIRTAQTALRGLATLNPAERARLHSLLGTLLRQAGQLDQAIHHMTEATRLTPADLETYLELGDTHLERRQYTQALQVYQKAISVAPQDARPYYQAGQALKSSRDYESAENMLRRAADLAPDDLTIHRQLAALVALNLVHNRRPLPIDR